MRLLLSLLAMYTLALVHPPSILADIAVVVSPRSPLTTLSQDDLKRYYLGYETLLPNGERIKLSDQPLASAVRQEFYSRLTGMSVREVTIHWSKLVFTGKGFAPVEFSDSNQIKGWLRSNHTGIGYLPSDQVDQSLRVILVLPE